MTQPLQRVGVVDTGFFFDRTLEFSDHGVVAIGQGEVRLNGPLDHGIVDRLGQSLSVLLVEELT